MKRTFFALIVALSGALATSQASAQPAAVTKTNPTKLYMHYMPWFESPETLGGTDWGFHWEFANRNPNIVDANGRRQIASHYYPKIGPYASRDPHVIEYHLLLMKLSGIDGVLIDWYGVQGTNGDVGNLLTNSNAIVNQVDDYGMKFGVIMEDRFSRVSSQNRTPDVEKAKANMAYLKNNYFNNPSYIRQNAGADPLVGVFGPIAFDQQSPDNPGDSVQQWTQILAEAGEDVDFVTLWYEQADAGANADGEFAWIYQDAGRTHLQHQRDFYRIRAPTLGTAGGVAYPGFNDYYQEGGTNTVIPFDIPHNSGQSLASTLALASQYAANVDFLQLATWNDFGEGTMFEPTVETGFNYLKQVQQFTGVPYGESELELVYRLYRARKDNAGNAAAQSILDQASANLNTLQIEDARTLLDQLDLPGDFDEDGDADGADFLKWQRQFGAVGLFPLNTLDADGNGDGAVDGDDLASWLGRFGAADVPAAHPMPEPSAQALLIIAGAATAMLRLRLLLR